MTITDLSTAERILILRRRQGLTLADLARRSGVSVATLCALESGRQPRIDTIEAVAAALGVTTAELLGS